MIKFCKGCKKEIPPMRIKAIPHTTTCVNCSDVNMKRCVTMLHGDVQKDDTWVDVIFIDDDGNPSHTTSNHHEEE